MNDACAALPFSSSVAVAEFPLVQNPSVALRQPHVALMLNPRIHAFTCSLPNSIRYLTSILPTLKPLSSFRCHPRPRERLLLERSRTSPPQCPKIWDLTHKLIVSQYRLPCTPKRIPRPTPLNLTFNILRPHT